MKYDFYFSQTQKDMQEYFQDNNNTYINGVEYTECIAHGKNIKEHSKINDYVFICTEDDSKITFK